MLPSWIAAFLAIIDEYLATDDLLGCLPHVRPGRRRDPAELGPGQRGRRFPVEPGDVDSGQEILRDVLCDP
jgi:hypothetical protein